MNSINAETTIANIIGFLDPVSASFFRGSDRRMKGIMDSREYWKEPVGFARSKENGREHPSESYHVSPGLHIIITRSSFKEWKCVSCGVQSDIPIHLFYGTVVCRKCQSEKIEYRVMGEKAACKKYFVKPSDLGDDVARIEKSRGVFRVLEHQVKSAAEKRLGKDVLSTKMDKRRVRANTIHTNRISSYKRRLHLLTRYTEFSIRRYRVRVDAYLRDVRVLMGLAIRHGLYDYIIQDVLDIKVTSSFSVDTASDRLLDLACFLSNCRRSGILMEDYETMCPLHDDFIPHVVFIEHCGGQTHFYEYVSKYIQSIESLQSRSRSVLMYTARIGDSLSREHRIKVCKILCEEEGVSFSDVDIFEEYIGYGTGDPVSITREYRKMIFLCSRGYDEDFDYFLNVHRMCVCQASSHARKETLFRTRGFPIMNRLYIDDRIPSMDH